MQFAFHCPSLLFAIETQMLTKDGQKGTFQQKLNKDYGNPRRTMVANVD
jgi:hypothetical protein